MSSSIYRILTHKHKLLHQVASEEIIFPLKSRTEDMINKTIDTLRFNKGVYAKKALAISAPQVGILKRFFIMVDLSVTPLGRRTKVICNPEIVEMSQEQFEDYEGCLSVEKRVCLVNRAKKLVLKYQDMNGNWLKEEFVDDYSRIIQHEYDHLNGIMMLDKSMKDAENPLYKPYMEKKKQERLAKKDQKSDDKI
jgi:peptide deformylase